MTDTDERARFDAWWTGRYGEFSLRAEWAETPSDAAWMAWRAQSEEIERYRKTLRDIVRQCNNPIHTCPAGMDRIIERVEEMAIDALGPQFARAALAQGGDK